VGKNRYLLDKYFCRIYNGSHKNDPEVEETKSSFPKTSCLLILNTPCNPTGSVIEKQEMVKIAALAVKNHFYITAKEGSCCKLAKAEMS
jgi:aspartate/methionine/tyrosine aminotransferase